MSGLSCEVFYILDKLIWLYWLVLIVYAVLSWVPDLRGSWSRFIDMLVEPVLAPIRRVIPPAGGIDWSFIAVIAILWIVDRFLVQPNAFACY